MSVKSPFRWLRVLGRVLIGKFDEPQNTKRAPGKAALYFSTTATNSSGTSSVSTFGPERVLMGRSPQGKKFHIVDPGVKTLRYLCGVKTKGRDHTFQNLLLSPQVCQNCKKRWRARKNEPPSQPSESE